MSTRGPRLPLTAADAGDDDTGRVGTVIDRFVTGFEWAIPTTFVLTPDELAWSVARSRRRRVRAGPGLLGEFVRLDQAPDAAIQDYARRWGPLWLCKHGEPWRNHVGECQPMEYVPPGSELFDDGAGLKDVDSDDADDGGPWYADWLSGWRELAREARGTLLVARRLQAGQRATAEEWSLIGMLHRPIIRLLRPDLDEWGFATSGSRGGWASRPGESLVPGALQTEFRDILVAYQESVGRMEDVAQELEIVAEGTRRMARSDTFQRRVLAELLNDWLVQGGVRPRIAWDDLGKPAVQLGGWGLIGALAVQLLFDCSKLDGLAMCTSCGSPYLPPKRRPRRDRNAYCPKCGIKAAVRDAAARYRQTDKYRETRRKWRAARKAKTS